MIQKTLSQPSVRLEQVALDHVVCAVDLEESWIYPIFKYIKDGEEPDDPKEAALVQRQAPSYSIVNE